MKRLRLCLLGGSIALAGCWDFFEPEFAQESAATVMLINAFMDDDGRFTLSGILVPGLDDDGFVRTVVRDTLYVSGRPVTSDTTLPNGNRTYSVAETLGPQALTQPFTIDPPRVADVSSGPQVRWSSPRPLDPDTIRLARGSDLVLHIAFDTANSAPPPAINWFVEMISGSNRFQIGANGVPPAVLPIPAQWIPATTDSVVFLTFTLGQSAQQIFNRYRGAYSYTVQIDHTLILR